MTISYHLDGKIGEYRVNPIALITLFLFLLILNYPIIWGSIWNNAGLVVLVHAMDSSTSQITFTQAVRSERLLRRAIEIKSNASAWRGLGFSLMSQGREEEAISAWMKDADNLSALTLAYRGWRAQKLGLPGEALQWYNKASILDPHVADEWLYRIGMAYRQVGDLSHAQLAFQRASELFPNDRSVWYQLGLVMMWQGQLQPALDAWQRGLTQATYGAVGESNLYYQIGKLQQRLMEPPDLTSAWDFYERALAVDHFGYEKWQKADTYFQRGAILASRQRWEESIIEYRLAIKLAPEHYWAYLGWASALWQMGRREEAEGILLRAIDIRPDSKGAYQQLGEYYIIEGDQARAREMFLEVLKIDPDDDKAWSALTDLQNSPYLK